MGELQEDPELHNAESKQVIEGLDFPALFRKYLHDIPIMGRRTKIHDLAARNEARII